MKNVLIIRLSSFGDIVQCLSVCSRIKFDYPGAKITFLTKKQFAGIAALSTEVNDVIAFDRNQGLTGWIKLCLKLRQLDFDIIYDAHSNIRTTLLQFLLLGSGKYKFFRRSKERIKRFFLFFLRINFFPQPYRGMISFYAPLKSVLKSDLQETFQTWDFSKIDKQKVEALLPQGNKFLVCSPSAAWPMKRWPISHWSSLFAQLKDCHIVILGGPADVFCEQFSAVEPDRVINLAGKLSLVESCYVISKAQCFLSADTGLIHVAEILNRPGISLVGPTAFGFPTHKNITLLEKDLSCRPCTKDGRGRCSQDIYQKCLVEIKPSEVARIVREKLNN